MTLIERPFDLPVLYALLVSLAIHAAVVTVIITFPIKKHFEVVNALDIQLAVAPLARQQKTAPATNPSPSMPSEIEPTRNSATETQTRERVEPTQANTPSVAVELSDGIAGRRNSNPISDSSQDHHLPSISIDIEDVRDFVGSNVSLELEASSQLTSVEAEYRSQWHKRVQRIGQLNYPASAIRQRISGRLTLQVAINTDGSLASVGILESSGHDALDLAAMDIVRQTAPYAPLPPNIRRTDGQYRFQSMWEFRR